MNPLTNVRNITKLNEQELKFGLFDNEKSWHNQYKDSAYIFVGGLPFELTEGDILCVFSQYGEIININLVRDKKSGKSKGYGFLAYEDQRSTILAVDNFNGIKLGGRTIRVDHVQDYRRPTGDEKDESGKYKEIEEVGCAPKTPPGSEEEGSEDEKMEKRKKSKKAKKDKKMKKAKKEKRKEDRDERNDDVKRRRTEPTKLEAGEMKSGKYKEDLTTKGHSKSRVGVEREKLGSRIYKEKTEHEGEHRSREKERSRKQERDYMPSNHNVVHHKSLHEKHDRQRDRPKDRHRSRSPFYGR